jgi:SAM-dependent methyltransferase
MEGLLPMVDADHQQRPSPVSYDAELQRHNRLLHQACGIQFNDHVLDIGCGTGQTTREAARAAKRGSAFGVDVSASAIERARAVATDAAVHNVTFTCADAQVHPFPRDHFDVAISRFGTMFFDDPAAAFANISGTLRPAGRLVMMVWQPAERNEWDVAIRQALGDAGGSAASTGAGSGAFSPADPPVVKKLLTSARFVNITFADINEPVYYGPDVAAAHDWVTGFTSVSEVLTRFDSAASADARGRLREMLTTHLSENGVWFNSSSWIVTAERV